MAEYPVVQLKRHRDERVRAGHPWIFAGEVAELPAAETAGALVEVRDARGKYLGIGLCNPRSNLLIRLVSRERGQLLDRAFWGSRLDEALALRAGTVRDTDAMRLVHAEADGLPGLVVDRYADWLVVQAVSLGVAERMDMWVDLLRERLSPRGIYERSDVPVRELEGLEQRAGVLAGEAPDPDLVIREGDYRLHVDLIGGQKTGFFLDQRPNRWQVQRLSADKRVLNTFSYSGGFSIAAAVGGAREVVSVDISESAIALGEKNARLNGVEDRCSWVAANAFDWLREAEKAGEVFDLIILDPPAFTKSKASIPGAVRGYKEINLRALRMLAPGGILVSASCSHHLDEGTFRNLILEASLDTGRRLQQIDWRGAGPDHPVLLAAPETHYLKCFYGVVHPGRW
ncbi:MAG: class I SAM-dependent rRNA methyltransferase [bacterium]|nr:class I SAM-dependent rRNA methyltransferase [bacterium]